ncbi:uncharacterized protein BDV14DRAFT_194724 [Aspergillus stella-maris]|uniref:uncharacterized protein n=1 Tax=Aspergillus stella-maris TaxID=1810926 RepID=UPI003CCCDC8E
MLPTRRFLSWDPKFTKRDPVLSKLLYNIENQKFDSLPGYTRIDIFLGQRVHTLMPEQYSYNALREFLERSEEDIPKLEGTIPISGMSADAQTTILLDERRDPSPLNNLSSRYWAEYTQHPPGGEAIHLEALNAKALYDTLASERLNLGVSSPERRSIYIRDLSPICALALILPVAVRYAPSLREFLFKYVTGRAFFGVKIGYPISPASTYTFEFHIPYFALRRSPAGAPSRSNHVARRKGEFQANFSDYRDNQKEFFHEAQISVLLVGIDEWVWTLYCLVETHFCENGPGDIIQYISSDRDAASGQGSSYSVPIWNPREYFLLVLSRRMSEVRFEWANLVQTLDRRFRKLEEDIFGGPPTAPKSGEDDDLFTTNNYTWAIQVLQLFSNQLIKTLEAWDEFSDKHLHIFHPDETPAAFLPKLSSHLESLDTDISELRFMYQTISRQIIAFESKRSNTLNTSALVEARASNAQADNIGLLTKVTVFYLPLGLTTAGFSVAFIPSDLDWRIYIGSLVGFTLLSVMISFNLAWLKRSPESSHTTNPLVMLSKILPTHATKPPSSTV